jgi:hypothetical protein
MTWLRRLAFSIFLVRAVRFPILLVLILAIALTLTAAAPPDSTTLAVNIAAAILAIGVPFLPLAQLHLDGPKMYAVSAVAAFVIAVGASLLTGDLKVADLQGGTLPLLEKFTIIFTASQSVFQLFKDHATVGPYLTTKPLLAAPAAPPKA